MCILINLYRFFLRRKNKNQYESLAPISNIKNSATLNMLINAVADKRNYNIALSGKYGAGKSSIIRSFFKGFRKIIYKPLYVSLGMLGLEEQQINNNELCQEIEKGIIQQIIYKEATTKLPDSNIKRVSKLKKRNVIYIMIVCIIFYAIKVSSMYIENYGELMKLLLEEILKFNIFNKIMIILIVLSIFLVISRFLAAFLKKIDIKNLKFNFSNTEIEIEKLSNESLISKYMDELVYFFSVTKYNIVVIEDLDRFLKNESIKNRVLIIFQKLKELNQVLNSSNQIKRKISFIYVVKDDLFKNEEERTKFFDEIIPVIPIMSNYNSYAELKNRFEDYNIDDKLIQDISPYINDFRVIINLKNEFVLYQKEINGEEIIKERQLAILVLKNIRPNEYENLLNNKGKIFDIIDKKEELINKSISIVDKSIKENNELIKKYKKQKLENFEELKRIAISNLYGKSTRNYQTVSILAEQFIKNYSYEQIENSVINIKDVNGYCFTELELFEYFKGKKCFLERAKEIKKIEEIEIDKLIIENTKLEKEKEIIEKKAFCELFCDEDIKGLDDDFLIMLLRNGYLDENYQDYMFKFKETKETTKNDYVYISNVRQHRKTRYDYKIKNVEKVIEQLNVSYFGVEDILNYNVMDVLLETKKEDFKEKKEKFIDMFNNINEDKENFILGFIKETQNKDIFIKKLHKKNNSIIYQILINNSDNIDKVELIIKSILNIPEVLNYKKVNDFIKEYVENRKGFLTWIEMNKNVKESLIILDIKFKEIDEYNNDFLEFIYSNNLYTLNLKMIKLFFGYKNFLELDFEQKNLSLIMNDNNLKIMKKYVEDNKNEYIENCYLKTSGIKNSPCDVIDCLNKGNIDEAFKLEIIKNMPFQIIDIRDVNTEYHEEIIKYNKMYPSWENYFYFYTKNNDQITDELLHNIELNIGEIKKQEIKSAVMVQEDKNRINVFLVNLVKNNQMNIDVYKQIIDVCKITLCAIEENEIENQRLNILVKNKIIEFTNNNLQVLYEQFPEIIDIYIYNNIQMLINNIQNYTLNDDIIHDVIKSSNIKFRDKNIILNNVDISFINEETMEFIIKNYSQNKISKINEELKEKIFTSGLDISYKLMFFKKELNKNNDVELIDKYLKLLPVPYNYIGDYSSRGKSFSINKTNENEDIINKLERKGFYFTRKDTKNKIMIHNKKYR